MESKTIELVFATHNKNKALEIQNLFPAHVHIKTLSEIGYFDEIPEEQETLEGNALQKARYVFHKFGVNCFADDTGLEVEALNNEPGVYSARYAGEDKSDEKNIALLLLNLKGVTLRKAQFRTAISLIIDGEEHVFEGVVKGEIRKEKSGNNGFGYDPIFEPESSGKTFAEMTLEEKNQISHRARAIKKLSDFVERL